MITINNILNTIHNTDCIEFMKTIGKESIHLVYADPPYNLSGKKLNLVNNKTGGAFYKMSESWDIFTENEYIEFSDAWIQSAYNTLVNNGSLYISCTYHNIGVLLNSAKQCGFILKNIITWGKTNAMPSITKRTFTHSTEYVCWFVKGKKWVFNYNELKKLNWKKTKDGESKQMRDLIELPIVQGAQRLKNDNNRALHPTQKPEKLIEIIITASSKKNDIVLDPFSGTGTTCIVAQRLGRSYIGIELDKKYYKASVKRLKDE